MVIHPLVIIRTANTETQSAVGHVPKERFEIPPRGIRHTIRAQLAQYENAIGRSEWVIGRHHAVAVGAGTNQSAMGYGMLSAGQYEFLPCFLHVLEDAQIGLEVIPCGGLDVGVSELSCDHADVGSGLDSQRAERVA